MGKLILEKRKQKRFAKRCIIEFTADGQTCKGIGRNLSLDGLFVKTRKPLPPDKIIAMVADLPDGSISKFTGQVKRAVKERHSLILERAGIPSNDGMGVQLVEADDNYKRFIASFPAVSDS